MRKPLLFATLGLLVASSVWGGVPNMMNVQGRLLNAGSPMSGTHPATFKVYDAASGGTLLWTENNTLDVLNGVFSAILGQVTPLPTLVFSSQPRWLEVTVEGTTLAPRLPLTTSAYAFWAQRADTANFALNAPPTGDNLWSTDGTNIWRAAGNVSVGTNSTEGPLTVYGQLQNPPNALILRNTLPGGGPMTFSIGATGATVPAGVYGLGDENDIRLAINRNTGSVGIGTTSPLNKLQVAGGGVMGDWLTSSAVALGNGSTYPVMVGDHLEFHGTYGYAVGDQYIDFQSGFNPSVGGQGTLARVTAIRNPEDYDLGRGRLKLSVRAGSSMTDMLVVDHQGVSIPGNLTVNGTKCREVDDPQYGRLFFNAVESGTADFTDRGEGRLVKGTCHVEFNPKWLAGVTIDDAHPMQVTITAYYGPHGGQEYVERTKTGFTLTDPSGSNAAFGWRVEARQRGYEDLYLNNPQMSAGR